jgi:hypothetical protein
MYWFRFTLKSLFLLVLLVATFFAGYVLATRHADETVRAEREARRQAEDTARHAEAEAKRLDAERLAAVIDLTVLTRLNAAPPPTR